MRNIKVAISPPYQSDKATYISKVESSIEFDNEVTALNFARELNLLIIRFTDKQLVKPDLKIVTKD